MLENVDKWPCCPNGWSDEMSCIVKRYLFRSPAYGVSRMAESFTDSMRITQSALAEAMLERIKEKIEIEPAFFDSGPEVEKALDKYGESPWNKEEDFYICTRTNKDSLREAIEKTAESSVKEVPGLGSDATKNILRRYNELDAMYRHIRNAIAHGCFRVVTTGGEDRFFFFDISSSGTISACGMLKFSSLDAWYNLSCEVAQKKL